MKGKAVKLIDHLIESIPAVIIVCIYLGMIFMLADFEISMLLLIGGLLIALVMGAMDIKIFPLRPIVIMYTLVSAGAFFYIVFKSRAQQFSSEDLIVVALFVITILLMLLISMTRPDNPANYIIRIIIDWYGVILLFAFLFSLYYFECQALVEDGREIRDLQTCTYFSCITFTGLGYGDIVTRPDFRMVAAMQSIIGYICMGGVAATIYSLIQSKLHEIHKAEKLEENEQDE